MKKQQLVVGYCLLFGNLISIHPAAAVSLHACPPEAIANADVKLTRQFPHFRINGNNTVEYADDVYEVCQTATIGDAPELIPAFDGCKPLGLPLKPEGTGLIIIGNRKRNVIRATPFNDTICGKGGNDFIEGREGDDQLYGNGGNDTLIGKKDNDILFGGSGNDLLYGLELDDENYDGDSDDVINSNHTDADQLFGGRGRDTLFGGPDSDVLRGEGGRDLLNGGEGLDDVDGGRGKDTCRDKDHLSGQNAGGENTVECVNSEIIDN